MIKRLAIAEDDKDICKFKFLKVYRMDESEVQDLNDESTSVHSKFALEDILDKSQDFLNDKVFKIDALKRVNTPDFKFVHLKIKKIDQNKTLL